jgi:proteic killer suppression protein
MEVRFKDESLDKLETDPGETGGYAQGVVTAFRKRMQFIRSAVDERDFYQMKSLHFEKLKGKRADQHSMRINEQYRLILEFEGTAPNKTIVIISIEDYH